MTGEEPEGPHPKIARLIDLWRELAPGPGLLPGRQHFDPAMVPDLLPNLWLVDVEPGSPRNYRFRLIGGRLVDAGLPARKGNLVNDPGLTSDPEAARLLFDRAADGRVPDWKRGKPTLQYLKFVLSLERVFLPLATDGRNVDMMLCMTLFHHWDGSFA